ncbi:phosphatidylinositol-specific phospholipase C domain-containing protein [Frankia sp. Cas4]|uniref:phosphatidylinositol-specific phospholipase C domain-containing protein n=1 Tax=Frankia sp. Cas4 TaxID=3073927 RepID=UPI002AD54036|nr:phosphatidylinositol-specific phospholipase C domain-containing protein [Frankia sp. Cas4]
MRLCRGGRRLLSVAGVATAVLVASMTSASPAVAAALGSVRVSHATTVGVHNTYDKADYTYLAQALDAGSSMIELDAWDDIVAHRWRVSHSNPLGNDNNCVVATSASALYTGNRNQNLGSCLSDIKWWLVAHPTAGPVFVKIEMKAGFDNGAGMGPDELDAYIKANVATDSIYRPADLLGGTHANLDAAATADAWPSRSALAGKMIIYVIPGTVELANPTDTLHTDVEYATYLRNLYAAGKVGDAMMFPAVLGAATGDPRTRYSDITIRPWFVFFDGDASTYVTSVNTSWYDTRHYILVMTDAHAVTPALNDTNPAVADAQARVAQLAADHASVVSTDWYGLPSVLTLTLTRG